MKRDQVQARKLRRESLRRSHADFRPRTGVENGIRYARGHRADNIGDRQDFGPGITNLALGEHGVGRFAGLSNEDKKRVRRDDRIAVSIFTRIVHFDRQASQRFDHVLSRDGGMPARPAGKNSDISETLPLVVAESDILEVDSISIERKSAENGIADGRRLLVDFLEHEMLVTALFGHDRIPRDVLELRRARLAGRIKKADTVA